MDRCAAVLRTFQGCQAVMKGAAKFKSHEAAAQTRLFCHLFLHFFLCPLSPVPLSAFKALNIRDLTLSHQRQGPGGDTSSATWVPPMTSVNTSCVSTTLVRSCCQKSFLLWTHVSAAWTLRGRAEALSQAHASRLLTALYPLPQGCFSIPSGG